MHKVSVNILTKNRAELLRKALLSVATQSFKDFEVRLISDGSTDNTEEVELAFVAAGLAINSVFHSESFGITYSRQEALSLSKGEYIAILDDDDEWLDPDKLKKQVEYLDSHPDCVLVGGGIEVEVRGKGREVRLRPEQDSAIRKTMLLRNNFFTSTVMFRKDIALKAGGFLRDGVDLAEDYDLWLRMGHLGKMHNFREAFVNYRQPSYNSLRFKEFLQKQLYLIEREKHSYPLYYLSALILKLRLLV